MGFCSLRNGVVSAACAAAERVTASTPVSSAPVKILFNVLSPARKRLYLRRSSYMCRRSEEHTSELQSHSDLHSFPTRRSSDLYREHSREQCAGEDFVQCTLSCTEATVLAPIVVHVPTIGSLLVREHDNSSRSCEKESDTLYFAG